MQAQPGDSSGIRYTATVGCGGSGQHLHSDSQPSAARLCHHLAGGRRHSRGKGASLSATASPHEKRHTVQAQCNRDGQVIASATCHVYSTSHPALIKTVHSFLDQHNIQTAVSVAVQGNDVDFSIDTGYTSLSTRESNGSGTLHYIYSITKTSVAAAVLQLVEEGKLTLNTTVGDILPEVEFDPVYINTSATVAELLSHTSGIQEYVDNPALFYKNPYRTSQWNPQFQLPFVPSP